MSDKKAIVWGQVRCIWCDCVKQFLDSKGYEVEYRVVGSPEYTLADFQKSVPDARSVPQTIINGQCISGYPDLVKYVENA